MLLFILHRLASTQKFHPCFNTSHVVIYRFRRRICRLCIVVSIHLMLLFITNWMQSMTWRTFVSIHLMLLFIWNLCFLFYFYLEFQYISCCYLSKTALDDFTVKDMFQYISCCYLSYCGKAEHPEES